MASESGKDLPGRELLEGLVLVVAGAELAGGAEAGPADGQGNGSLQTGPGHLGSFEKAGRADGAGSDTEDGKRRHGCQELSVWRGRGGEKRDSDLEMWMRFEVREGQVDKPGFGTKTE